MIDKGISDCFCFNWYNILYIFKFNVGIVKGGYEFIYDKNIENFKIVFKVLIYR